MMFLIKLIRTCESKSSSVMVTNVSGRTFSILTPLNPSKVLQANKFFFIKSVKSTFFKSGSGSLVNLL